MHEGYPAYKSGQFTYEYCVTQADLNINVASMVRNIGRPSAHSYPTYRKLFCNTKRCTWNICWCSNNVKTWFNKFVFLKYSALHEPILRFLKGYIRYLLFPILPNFYYYYLSGLLYFFQNSLCFKVDFVFWQVLKIVKSDD